MEDWACCRWVHQIYNADLVNSHDTTFPMSLSMQAGFWIILCKRDRQRMISAILPVWKNSFDLQTVLEYQQEAFMRPSGRWFILWAAAEASHFENAPARFPSGRCAASPQPLNGDPSKAVDLSFLPWASQCIRLMVGLTAQGYDLPHHAGGKTSPYSSPLLQLESFETFIQKFLQK